MNIALLEQAGVDFQRGLSRFLGDQELYASVLSFFLEDKAFDRAEAAFVRKDYPDMFAHIHELKGASGNLDITYVYREASVLSDLLRSAPYNEVAVAESFARFSDAYHGALTGIRAALAADA